MKAFKSIGAVAVASLFSQPLKAQSEILWLEGSDIGNFFICIISGILLAFAFQFLLTNLGVAIGVTAIGNLKESDSGSSSSSSGKDSDSTPVGVKISTGFGIFLLISMCITLFFASLIAVKLTLIPSNLIGFTLGLVIWAGYLLLWLYLDSKAISSLLGSVVSTIKNGLGAGASAVDSLVGTSPAGEAKKVAKSTIQTVTEEVRKEFDSSALENKLDEYVKKLKPQSFDLNNIQDHLADLLNQVEVKEMGSKDPETTKKMILEVASEQPNFSKEDQQKLSDAFDKAKEIWQKDGSKEDKAVEAVGEFTPLSEEDAQKYKDKVARYLKDSGRDELKPENLQKDIEKILSDPQSTPDVVRNRASMFDRDTLTALISAPSGVSQQDAQKYVRKVENVFKQITDSTSSSSSDGSSSNYKKNTNGNQSEEGKNKAKQATQKWFNQMEQPELSYDQLKGDLNRIMDDPSSSPTVIKNRLNRMDSDSVKALLSNNPMISEDQAAQFLGTIEDAKETVLQKVDEVERTVKERMNDAKREALKQAEAARKTAMAAAWWFFIASVAGGAASAFGGMLALNF